LLADRQRAAPAHNIIACFSCGYTFVYQGRRGELNGRFCSMRCRDWYDDGNPSHEQQREHERKLLNAPFADLVVVAGPPNVKPGSKHYRPGNQRRQFNHEADCRSLRKFMVAANIPFECEMDYLDKGWKSPLRRPAVTPSAEPGDNAEWRISGKWGSVFSDGKGGYLLSVETRIEGSGSFMEDAPLWDDVLSRLDFCRADGGEGSLLYLNGLPTGRQGVAICSALGLPRNREKSKVEGAPDHDDSGLQAHLPVSAK
jgi:hypothetical protein